MRIGIIGPEESKFTEKSKQDWLVDLIRRII